MRGQIATQAGINIETLRYYENYGLIAPPQRSESGYRLYSSEVLSQLEFIKNAKLCGFTLKEIKKALNKTKHLGIGIDDFIAVIDAKTASINAEIAHKEETKTMLGNLRAQLLSTNKPPEVTNVLQILNVNS